MIKKSPSIMISTTMLGDFLVLLVFVPYMNILLCMVQIFPVAEVEVLLPVVFVLNLLS
jgi:hypothetical protein